MDGTREPRPDQPPYLRLPWPLVAAGLVVVVAAALAIGLFATRTLRPQIGLLPTATSSPIPVALPANTPTPEPALSIAPTPLILATRPPPIVATPTPPPATVAPVSNPSSGTPEPIASPVPSPLATVEPALAEEVGRAYVNFWRVRSQALLELDPTHLPEVMDGDYLRDFEARLARLKSQGRAIKTQVVLNYQVMQVTNRTAVVVDRVEDDSFYVTPGSDQSITEPSNDVLRLTVTLMRVASEWKVVGSVSAD